MGRANKPPSAQRIKLAVEMRIGGSAWERVAERLGCSAETVRKWPTRYAGRWHTASHDAECRLAERTHGDTRRALRTLLNDPSSTIRFRAARALVNERIELLKLRLHVLAHARPESGGKLAILAETLGKTDEKLAELVMAAPEKFAIQRDSQQPSMGPN